MHSSKIKILIVDDHAVVRMGLAALFSAQPDFEVVGQVKNGDEAIAKALQLQPDIVLMDLMMPKLDGIEATKRIRQADENMTIKILILTSYATSDGVARALKAGASGAVLKSAENTILLAALRAVAAGKVYLDAEIKSLMNTDPPVSELTGRQSEILQSLTNGLTNKDIALQLGISIRSVEEHVNHILEKLGAANRSEAVAIALRKQLLKI